MTPENIQFIKSCKDKMNPDAINLDDDFLYKNTIDDTLQESISKLDYSLNWAKIGTHEKLWFLYYILIPVNESKNYRDMFRAIYNQNIPKVMQNSILNMFNAANI